MLVRFTPKVSLNDVGNVTERCEVLGIQYKFIQELDTSYLVIESSDRNKLEELYHQLRHMDFVDRITLPHDPDGPLQKTKLVKIKYGNRWLATGSRPVVIAGSPFLESQKKAVSLANDLSVRGVNIFKAGPYRPTETLAPKALYERTGSIVAEVSRRSGIPSTGMIEILGPKNALEILKPCAYHVPGGFMFESGLLEQLAKIGTPVFLERHPDASTALWLESAGQIVAGGNPNVALVEGGRRLDDGGSRVIDFVSIAHMIETCPLPMLVYPSRVAESSGEVKRITRAAIAVGASGVILDVHPDPVTGLLTEGFCLSIDEYEDVYDSLKPMFL
jgi:3-deoxy-7-phosphoheptulonate synthase